MDSAVSPFAPLRAGGPAPVPIPGARTVVAIAELDRFVALRARVGYSRADRLMTLASERLRAAVPEVAIGRVGRSAIEFALAAPSLGAAELLLARVGAAIREPVTLDGFEVALAATIGAVDVGEGPILDAAVDLAFSTVAEAQRRRLRVLIVDVDTPQGGVDELALLRDLPAAMRDGALQVHYQPKLRVRANRIDAAEALIRWDHPVLGPVRVEPFIRLLEETGAVARLTDWVVERAIADRATLAAHGHPATLWVNLSGLLLADDAFVARTLARVGNADGGIGFEITETAVIGDAERAIANLAALAAAGVRIAIDDYGSGLSSLAYLQQLPAHELKIDRLFIKGLAESHRDPLLVRSTIDLAHALDMEVTAEGVDDPMALALLGSMGCDMVQGFILAPALPLAELRLLLDDHARVAGLAAPRGAGAWLGAAARRGAGEG